MSDFIKRLAVETSLSYNESVGLVSYIQRIVGHISTAIKIYEIGGLHGLELYEKQLDFGIRY